MEALKINNTEIHSLEELRQHFDLNQVITAFLDCSLEKWLANCFYEKQAEQVRSLDHAIDTNIELELCRILGVDYVASGYLSEEQRIDYERKCRIIQQHSDDPKLLEHALDTATNQAELAEFLHNDKHRIYLCGTSFNVPIRISGVHYIGIGNPKMEAAFTEEQYRRAGITFEGIDLPKDITSETISVAEQAAAANGYDNFAEKHCPLASALHFSMKGHRLSKHLRLSWDTSVASEFYKSKYAAECAVKKEVDSAYDQANDFFIPGSRSCIASELADRYAVFIKRGCGSIVEQLVPWCARSNALKPRLQDMEKLIVSAAENLRKLFEQELSESSDYYRMYKRSYFHERIDIEKNDYNVDMFDSDILNGIARLIHDDSEYDVRDMYETMSEMEDDVNSHADTFFGRAYEAFCEYCEEIEEIAEEIGADLSGDDMEKLGIKRVENAS